MYCYILILMITLEVLTNDELFFWCLLFFFSDSWRKIAILRPAQNLSNVRQPSAIVTFFKLVTIPFGKCSSLSFELGDHLSAMSGKNIIINMFRICLGLKYYLFLNDIEI